MAYDLVIPDILQIAMKDVSLTPDNYFVFGDSETLCMLETFDYVFDVHLSFSSEFASKQC